MTDTVSSHGKLPLYVEKGTADTARTALQATFVGCNDMILFKSVHIGRTKIKAWLILTFIHTLHIINNPDMWLFIDVKTVQEELVFNIDTHFTLLMPPHTIRSILKMEDSSFIFFKIAFCLSFLETPSTVSISLAAKPDSFGKRVKSS